MTIAPQHRWSPQGATLMGMMFFLQLGIISSAYGEDWPTFGHDSFRSNHTSEILPATKLQLAWTCQSPQPPQTAWAGPAKWDAYANVRGLRSMRKYDPVFHTTTAGDRVFFGSSVDDSVHCLDAKSGEEIWHFMTDAPVRIAPTVHEDKLYFGSDDGYAYCIRAHDGQLVWKFQAVTGVQRLLHNGRFISPWPIRTGVLVDNGTAYFGASMLPWKRSYLCAVDALTGIAHGEGRYVRKLTGGLTLEGPLLASADLLVVPQGRIPPQLFKRSDGLPLGTLEGGGGCFVLITKDQQILHGPGNKTGWITQSNMQTRAKIASFAGANAMVMAEETAYLLTDRSLGAVRRADGRKLWQIESTHPYALIKAGEMLLAGGMDKVTAYAADSGDELWTTPVHGRAYGLAVAGGMLLVSTDEGAIHAFRTDGPAAGTSAEKPANAHGTVSDSVSESPMLVKPIKDKLLTFAVEPYLQFDSPHSAIVRWRTKDPSPSILRVRLGDELRTVQDSIPKTEHQLGIEVPRHNRMYRYQIEAAADGVHQLSREYECDTFFNYQVVALPDGPNPYPVSDSKDKVASMAKQILVGSKVQQGICVVLGCTDGRLAYELAQRSELRVIAVDTDKSRVEEIRARFRQANCYGTRVAVHHVESLAKLPLVGAFANLVVSERFMSEGALPGTAAEIMRILRPGGGVACLGQPKGVSKRNVADDLRKWVANSKAEGAKIVSNHRGTWARIVRDPLPGAGEWSHQYGTADNTAFGGETLQGSSKTQDLAIHWLGRPGPRAQADRNGRKPSPLALNGRLFVQGLHRIIALDSYNGTILWSHEIPNLERFNIPRDCSNWCADDDYVYVAVGRNCRQIDAQTGDVVSERRVAGKENSTSSYQWGYIGRVADKLIGSAVKEGTPFTNFWGGGDAGWYDARSGAVTHKVCSDRLFAMDHSKPGVQWHYQNGVILNSTISGRDDRLYFVECRNKAVKASGTRRVGMKELWQDQFLVALDIDSGIKVWEQPLDTVAGTVVFYMACGEDKLVVVASSEEKFHVYAFDRSNGSSLWSNSGGWLEGKGDHGKAMSRPAIVGGEVYVRPWVFDLANGEKLDVPMQGGGCGTYAAIRQGLIYRSGNVTLWDRASGNLSSWNRLRPGCWLSAIPASGMVLSPEAGGGCSCGSWLETSVGFMPKPK